MPKIKYNLTFGDDWDEAMIERYMIQNGGEWKKGGSTFGLGLIPHLKNYWSLLWPQDDQTWWTDLIMKEVLENQFTGIVGGASAWKSGTIARLALMDWSCYPDCTTVIMSSTDMEGLKARIFGETLMLWRNASARYGWFPGNPVDSKCVITYDDLEDDDVRDLRNSIVGVPCKTSSGKFVGMGKYAGRKNRRVWCVGDEFQFMELSILDGQKNLVSNGPNLVPGIIRDAGHKEINKPRRGYKAVFIANTNPSRPGNPIDMIAEPEGGWGSIPEDNKTKTWWAKQLPDHPVKCKIVNLDSLDSPNSAYPIDNPRWVHLAGPHKVKLYTQGSESYWSQGRGVFKFGLAQFKIITKEICDQFHAFDKCVWDGMNPRTKIGMLDAAYGAGDRCALGWLEFGRCFDGKIRIQFSEYWLVPITIRPDMKPEDQIAIYCKKKMEAAGVPPENFFFDGRGGMAMSLAALWSSKVNAIEFGGTPTDRLAGPDIYTTDKFGVRRLKTEKEHYSKNVSALWWAWRYITESDQMRGLTHDIVSDAQPREWYKVGGDKIEIETKKEMKKRTGVSPDLADMLVSGLEGARQRGFQISKLGNQITQKDDSFDKLVEESEDMSKTISEMLLNHG